MTRPRLLAARHSVADTVKRHTARLAERHITLFVLASFVFGGGLVLTSGASVDPAYFSPAPVVPLAAQAPARLVVDSPLPDQLAMGRLVVRYRTENLRIAQVFGPAALNVSPRVGHLHLTVDDAPWHWLDASGEPVIVNGLPPGPHKLLVELADANHKILDRSTINFEIPARAASRR